MDPARLASAVGVAAVGGLIVGPYVSYVVLRWIGWRVTLPVVLGYVPERSFVGAPPVRCRRCAGDLAVGPWSVPRTWSWLWRWGRCRSCREPVAAWVAGVEAVTAVAFGLSTWGIGGTWSLLPVLALCGGLIAASTVDLACWRIPTRFVYLNAVLVAGLILLATQLDGEWGSLWGALVGALVYTGVLGAMYLASPRLLGLGDVRLGALIGMVVGWTTWTSDFPVLAPLGGVLQALLLASVAGTVVGLGLLVVRRRSSPYPFGPWLSLGGLVTVVIAVSTAA